MSTCCPIIYIPPFNLLIGHIIVLRLQNDLLLNMDRGHVTLLVLLDLSWAFDTVDRSILLSRLQHKFGFDGLVLSWFVLFN